MTDWRDNVRAIVAGTAIAEAAALAHVEAALAAGAAPDHAADLALAFAAGRGDPVALRRFEEHVGAELVAAARAIDREPAFVDEVVQRTRIRLTVGEGDQPPRVASYKGAGPLRAWVAVAAQRIALNARRDARAGAARVAAPVADPDVLAELVDREPDPELRHLKTIYRAEFREALTAALAGLPDRTRTVLRLRFVDGLELAQLGRLYRVHEATASRWISSALDDIGHRTREQLIARLAITEATAASVVRMVHSQLDLSIARLLG